MTSGVGQGIAKSRMRIWVTRAALGVALARPQSPSRIPLSGDGVLERDYVHVSVFDEEYWYDLKYLTSRGARTAIVRRYEQPPDWAEGSVLNAAFTAMTFRVIDYYRETEIRYDSPGEYLLHQWVGYRRFARAKDRILQFWFNRRRLVRRDRIAVLRAIAEVTIKRESAQFSRVGIMAELYGMRWPLHPEGESVERYCELMLESLAADGDLVSTDGYQYRLAPGGLRTLADYELEERRHGQMRSRQTLTILLTVVLAAIAGLQAYQTWQSARLSLPLAEVNAKAPGAQ
jgi:hypothetical protein